LRLNRSGEVSTSRSLTGCSPIVDALAELLDDADGVHKLAGSSEASRNTRGHRNRRASTAQVTAQR
jgi:hypothetical protein